MHLCDLKITSGDLQCLGTMDSGSSRKRMRYISIHRCNIVWPAGRLRVFNSFSWSLSNPSWELYPRYIMGWAVLNAPSFLWRCRTWHYTFHRWWVIYVVDRHALLSMLAPNWLPDSALADYFFLWTESQTGPAQERQISCRAGLRLKFGRASLAHGRGFDGTISLLSSSWSICESLGFELRFLEMTRQLLRMMPDSCTHSKMM